MIIEYYSIYDSKSMTYSQPEAFMNDSVAARAAQNLIDNGDTEISRHPGDFSLFHVGFFDDATAEFTPCVAPRRILSFNELQPRQLELGGITEEQLDMIESAANTNVGDPDYLKKMAEAFQPDPIVAPTDDDPAQMLADIQQTQIK